MKMELVNARIKVVSDVTGNDSNQLGIGLVFEVYNSDDVIWWINLLNPEDVKRLNALMLYANVRTSQALTGQIVRIITGEDNLLNAFGDAIADIICPIATVEFKECSLSEFKAMFPKELLDD